MRRTIFAIWTLLFAAILFSGCMGSSDSGDQETETTQEGPGGDIMGDPMGGGDMGPPPDGGPGGPMDF